MWNVEMIYATLLTIKGLPCICFKGTVKKTFLNDNGCEWNNSAGRAFIPYQFERDDMMAQN
jgi:hypothetical protein